MGTCLYDLVPRGRSRIPRRLVCLLVGSVPQMITVVVPVLDRPQNAQPLVDSLNRSGANADLMFICSPNDTAEIDACVATGMLVKLLDRDPAPADYARKIQAGYESSQTPYILCGADDLRFHEGWYQRLLEIALKYDVGVVGTNDLGNQATVTGSHSTHPLVARAYIEHRGGYVGGRGQVYFDGYSHQYVDSELCETAKQRGCYAHCHDSLVEHLHPLWNKSEMDATYRRSLEDGAADRRLFESRHHLWLTEGLR